MIHSSKLGTQHSTSLKAGFLKGATHLGYRFYPVQLILGFALLISLDTQAIDNAIKFDSEQAQHVGIRTIKPEPTSKLLLARVPARVSLPPRNEYSVGAPLTGWIHKIDVAIGFKVAKGQLLTQIRSPDLLNLQREYLDSLARYDLAKIKLDRDKTLFDEGIVAKIRWQETASEYEKSATALSEAEQVLQASDFSHADIQLLKKNRRLNSFLDVRSPIDGVVLESLGVVGQRIEALTPLFRIGKLDELWLEIDMPMERLREIKIGDSLSVENTRLTAKITHVGQSVNQGSQSALVRAVIEGATDQIHLGQHVNVSLMHDSSDRLFRLPLSAITRVENQDYVFVKTPDGYAARPVSIAGKEEHKVVIHQGLSENDEVVTQGLAALKARWLGIGSEE